MRLRTHHKLFLSYAFLVAAVVVALSFGVEALLRGPLVEQAQEELLREVSLGRELLDRSPEADPDSLARRLAGLTGHRVTVVAPDGEVLGDSGVEPHRLGFLENHGGRPEIRAALERGAGVAVRRSVSVDADLVYAAVPTETGATLRFAAGIEEIESAVAGVRRRILQVGAVALIIAGAFSFWFSLALTRSLRHMRQVALAMSEGDLSARVGLVRRDELGDLGAALDGLAEDLQLRIAQLEEERQEMDALIDSMAEAVLAVASDGSLRRANPAARAIFGLDSSPEGLLPEEVSRRREFLDLMEAALGGEDVSPTELTHGGRHLLATGHGLPQGGGVLVFLDITEVRRLEGVRRDFVANASHELKTPLTVIRGQAETLLNDDLPPDLRSEFSRRLHANAERLQRILDDLLDLSRIESGGWKVTPEPLRLDEAAREAWAPFAEGAGEQGIEFTVEVEEAARQLEADPEALHQIFRNLFSNALRYTSDGGRIVAAARLGSPDEVMVEVRDTGSGIPTRHLDRIFERFYRVDPARSRAEGGTGLGLAIVRHLVERHGGRVEAESELGRGTTIRFIFPLAGVSGEWTREGA